MNLTITQKARIFSNVMSPQTQWRRNEFDSGGTRPVQSIGNNFCRASSLFCSTSSLATISRFGERFRYGQYSLVTFLLTVCCSPTHGAPVPSHL